MFIEAATRTYPAVGAPMSRARRERHRVVAIGRGPAVDKLARALRRAPVDVLVLDHGVSSRVEAVDSRRRVVLLSEPELREIPYDTLAVATGAQIRFAGGEEWQAFSGADDLGIEDRVRMAHEFADSEPDPAERARLLTFAVVGGGASEIAVAIALAERAREIIGEGARVILAAHALLPGAPEYRSERQARALNDWGVELRLGAVEHGADHAAVDGERIDAGTIVWAAGVTAAEAARWLGAAQPRFVHVMSNGRDGTDVAQSVLREVQPRGPRTSFRLALALAAGDALGRLRSEWRAALS